MNWCLVPKCPNVRVRDGDAYCPGHQRHGVELAQRGVLAGKDADAMTRAIVRSGNRGVPRRFAWEDADDTFRSFDDESRDVRP